MIEQYDPKKFHVVRLVGVTKAGGGAYLGSSSLAINWTSQVEVPTATFSYSADYTDEDNVLIVGSETASVSVTVEALHFTPPLLPADYVRVTYASHVVFDGIVDTAKTTKVSVSDVPGLFEFNFSATLVGVYGLAMTKEVCWTGTLPAEPAITRLRRWVEVVE